MEANAGDPRTTFTYVALRHPTASVRLANSAFIRVRLTESFGAGCFGGIVTGTFCSYGRGRTGVLPATAEPYASWVQVRRGREE